MRIRALTAALLATVPLLATPLAAGASTSWAIVSSPNSSVSQRNVLFDVTCNGVNDCWAVGWHGSVAGGAQTLIERHTSSEWTIVSSPNANSAADNVLYAVTCVDDTDCWAVGSLFGGGSELTLIEHFDGHAWSVFPSANASSFNSLSDVACSTAADCWAVGEFESATGGEQLIEHFDGAGWHVIDSPTAGTITSALAGVTCTPAGPCWAVGSHTSGNRFRALIEREVAGDWSIVTSPVVGLDTSDGLGAVTCVSRSDCWAVGNFTEEGSVNQTLAEHYTGSGWSIVSSENANSRENALLDVACVSSSACWAAGEYTDDQGRPQTLIEQHTTGGWNVVASPQRGSFFSGLSGLACTFAGDCWAAGSYGTSPTLNQTLIAHGLATSGPDLSMNLRAASTSSVGHSVTYRLHVANRGPGVAADVHVHFSLPSGTTFATASGNGALDSNGDSVRWKLPALGPLESVVLTVTLRMDQPKSMRASASAYSSSPDPDLTNNVSSVRTVVGSITPPPPR